MLRWSSVDTEASLNLVVNDLGGPLTGATCTVALRDATTADSWLDFGDGTFKSAGWISRTSILSEVDATNAPGVYRHELDLTAITLPASQHLVAEYEVTSHEGFPTALEEIAIYEANYAKVIWDFDAWSEYTSANAKTSAGAILRILGLLGLNKATEDSDADPAYGTLTFYEDDDATPAKTFQLRDESGAGLDLTANVPARRSQGT